MIKIPSCDLSVMSSSPDRLRFGMNILECLFLCLSCVPRHLHRACVLQSLLLKLAAPLRVGHLPRAFPHLSTQSHLQSRLSYTAAPFQRRYLTSPSLIPLFCLDPDEPSVAAWNAHTPVEFRYAYGGRRMSAQLLDKNATPACRNHQSKLPQSCYAHLSHTAKNPTAVTTLLFSGLVSSSMTWRA